MVTFVRNRFQRSVTALSIMYLSLAVLLIAPSVPPAFNNLSVVNVPPNNQKLDASSEILAATNSLESGQGPPRLGPISCSQNGFPSASCATSAAAAPLLSAASSAQSWTQLGPAHPSTSLLGGIAYDAADGYVVLFGGATSIGSVNGETWKYSRGAWTQITPNSSPPARFGGAMTYDTVDGYILLFGGFDSAFQPLRDTWKFSTGAWTNITSSSGPSARAVPSMAYDALSADQYVVLFGGTPVFPSAGGTIVSAFKDTWKFSLGSWTNITMVTGPSPRAGASISYDAADGYILLFGGQSPTAFLGDTWKFSTGSWTSILVSNNPGKRILGSMAYDAAAGDGYVVLFGGANNTISTGFKDVLGDTWKFSAGSWTNITTTSGPNRGAYIPMVYDASDGYVLLTVGSVSWAFKGGLWTNIPTNCSTAGACPPPRYGSSTIYDVADGYVVLFGGCCKTSSRDGLLDTWEFHAGVWTNVTTSAGPSPRLFTAMAYDAVDGYGVLFGGVSSNPTVFPFSGTLGDTWKFAGGSWTNITTTTGPPARTLSTLAYDAADGYTLLFGGVSGTTGFFGDTWRFLAGTWTNIPNGTAPSARSNGSIAYDDADHYIVLFGGTSSAVGLGDTWSWGQVAGTKTTSTSLQCFLATIDIGQTSECQVYVYDSSGTGSSTPTGTVLFSQTGISTGASFTGNPCTLTAPPGGAATCSVTFSSTSTGVASITAVYSGDTGYAASTSTSVDVTVTIAAHQTTAAISCSPNPVLAGVYSTCTATVTDTSTSRATTPTGQVTMSFQSPAGGKANELCTLSGTGATASCSGTIAYLAAFTANIQAAYAGDTGPPAHYGSTGSTILTATARPTTTTLTCIPASVNTGSATTCTASVTDNAPISTGLSLPPTGTVGFTTSGTGTFATSPCTLTAGMTTGTATCSVTYTPTGSTARTDTITGSYGGDASHATSTNTFSLQVTVVLHPSTTTIACTPSTTVLYNQDVACTVTVTDTSATPTTPTGTISFGSNVATAGVTCTLVGSGATAACTGTMTVFGIAPLTIDANYSGDVDHAPS